jgi:hypothetical protein
VFSEVPVVAGDMSLDINWFPKRLGIAYFQWLQFISIVRPYVIAHGRLVFSNFQWWYGHHGLLHIFFNWLTSEWCWNYLFLCQPSQWDRHLACINNLTMILGADLTSRRVITSSVSAIYPISKMRL